MWGVVVFLTRWRSRPGFTDSKFIFSRWWQAHLKAFQVRNSARQGHPGFQVPSLRRISSVILPPGWQLCLRSSGLFFSCVWCTHMCVLDCIVSCPSLRVFFFFLFLSRRLPVAKQDIYNGKSTSALEGTIGFLEETQKEEQTGHLPPAPSVPTQPSVPSLF